MNEQEHRISRLEDGIRQKERQIEDLQGEVEALESHAEALEEEIQRLRSIINDLSLLAEERLNFNEADLIRHRLAGGDRDFGPLSERCKHTWKNHKSGQ
jgi:chromosome segregation ATPase